MMEKQFDSEFDNLEIQMQKGDSEMEIGDQQIDLLNQYCLK